MLHLKKCRKLQVLLVGASDGYTRKKSCFVVLCCALLIMILMASIVNPMAMQSGVAGASGQGKWHTKWGGQVQTSSPELQGKQLGGCGSSEVG